MVAEFLNRIVCGCDDSLGATRSNPRERSELAPSFDSVQDDHISTDQSQTIKQAQQRQHCRMACNRKSISGLQGKNYSFPTETNFAPCATDYWKTVRRYVLWPVEKRQR